MNRPDDELRSMQDELARLARERRQLLPGIYRGKVVAVGTRSDGGEGRLGQLQVSIPELWGDSTDVPWAHPLAAFAGDGYGTLLLPRVDDGVYVVFEGGSLDHPVWLGGFWSENAALPEGAGEHARLITSPAGHRVLIDDEAGQLQLRHADGSHITLEKDEITLEVQGGGKIVISKSGVAINGTALTVDK